MSSNYPPGVNGREFEIAGPDYERDSDEICDHIYEDDRMCNQPMVEQGYRYQRWLLCAAGHVVELPTDDDDDGPDPDEAYDRWREGD